MGQINQHLALAAEAALKPLFDITPVTLQSPPTSTWRSHFLSLAATLAVGATTGCSGGKESSVSGRVTLDGQPVRIGNVAFEPQTGGMMAHAEIGSNGEYKLQTNQESGLVPGKYAVKVISRETTPIPPGGGLPPPGKLLVPEKYIRVATSGLTFEVERGENQIDIELLSK